MGLGYVDFDPVTVDFEKSHVIAAIAVLVFFPAAAPIILMAAKGAIIGAVSGGLIGGISSLCSGGSFLEGFEEGAFSGAVCGLVFGGIGGAGQMFGGSCRAVQMLGGTEKAMRAVGNTLKVTGGLSAVMTGFDLLALGVGMFVFRPVQPGSRPEPEAAFQQGV